MCAGPAIRPRQGVRPRRWPPPTAITIVSARFAAAVEAYGVKPKHVGLIAILSSGTPASQQELAATMDVAPSLVVSLADQLESLGAIERVRDPDDRRRQKLSLTEVGRGAARRLHAGRTRSRRAN